jgi:dihydrofolate reductase
VARVALVLRSFKLRFDEAYAWVVPALDGEGCPFGGRGVTLRDDDALLAQSLAEPLVRALDLPSSSAVRALSVSLEAPRKILGTYTATPRPGVMRLDEGPALSLAIASAQPLIDALAACAARSLAARERAPLAMILALGANGALGLHGGLPWSCPEDRAHFEAVTRGHAVILGRRTFEETGAPLEGRRTFVVSRTMAPRDGVTVLGSLRAAIDAARRVDAEPFVLGGARIFDEALPWVTRVALTRLAIEPEADVFYKPDLTGFRVASEREGEGGARFIEYVRG